MNFKDYYLAIPVADRADFAERCQTKPGQLSQIAYGHRTPSPILAVNIEQQTGGQVSRRDLFPSDWHRIWPELTTPIQTEKVA